MSGRRVILISVAVVAVVTLLVAGFVLHARQGATATTSYSRATWTTGGSPFVADVTVLDSDGRPVVGATVNAQNLSGANVGKTDARGRSSITVYERELEALKVNGVIVMEPLLWSHSRPDMTRGLRVKVTLTNLAPFGLAN